MGYYHDLQSIKGVNVTGFARKTPVMTPKKPAASVSSDVATSLPNGEDKQSPAAVPVVPPAITEVNEEQIARMQQDPEAIRRAFESGEYPYKKKISTKDYEKSKSDLQVELLKVQDWIKTTGQKIVMIFEGRDAAGKGGTIKRFTEHLNPRSARVVALEKPNDREASSR